MRRGTELLCEQKVLLFDGLLKIALAEAEARAGDADRAVAILDEALATAGRFCYRAFEAELHRARGDALLMRDPANSLPAEETFLIAIAVAKQQGTRSFELRAALSLAKLYQSTCRAIEAQAVLAPALVGFSPTPKMPEIAEGQALLAALVERGEVGSAIVQQQRRIHLQTTLAHAEMWSKGFAAGETATALARAVELTSDAGEFSDRLAAAHVQWTMAIARGELSMARELASAMLREAEDTGHRMETSVARRGLALIYYFSGAFLEARSQCQRALADCDPERDQEVRERFGDDIGTVVMSILALTTWNLGDVNRARELIDEANRHATELGHRVSEANPLSSRSILELLRGDATAALSAAERLETLGREQGMAFWLVGGEMVSGWARGHLGDPVFGAAQLRRALTSYAEQGARVSARFFQGLLAEIEAETLGVESALARIEEALTDADQVEYRWDLAFIHRLHGNLLLKRDPHNPAAAEVAFQSAIAIAKRQGARSLGLQAALSLAKLYQSTARPVEAHDILGPALEGFSPTPEMPEIAEAQALLVAFSETDQVKVAVAQRERRLHLQTAYGQAVMWSKGFGAEETKAAFARAAELAAMSDDFSERFAAAHGQWTIAILRSELRSAQELAAAFLRQAEEAGRMTEAGVARRGLGLISYFLGDFVEARSHCERALASCDSEHEEEARERYGEYTGTLATAFLANASWQLGDVERSRELIETANRRAAELGHNPSMANPLFCKSYLAILRGDVTAALSAAAVLEALAQEQGMALQRTWPNCLPVGRGAVSMTQRPTRPY